MNANESKGVLTVLDGYVEAIKNLCEPVGVIESYKLREARAAVAELIEASKELVEISKLAMQLDAIPAHANGPLPRTIAALARVDGRHD